MKLPFLKPRRPTILRDNCRPEHKPCDFQGEVEGSIKVYAIFLLLIIYCLPTFISSITLVIPASEPGSPNSVKRYPIISKEICFKRLEIADQVRDDSFSFFEFFQETNPVLTIN